MTAQSALSPQNQNGHAAKAASPTSVIIVAYNNADDITTAIESVLDQTPPPVELVVVDNASADDTLQVVERATRLHAQHPTQIIVVPSDTNLGFGAGMNVGAAHATGEWLLLFNPDAKLTPDTLLSLHAFAAEQPQHQLYGGRSVEADGHTLNPASCFGAMSLWSLFCFATGLSTLLRGHALFDPESLGAWQRDSDREVDIVSGSMMLVRRSLWDTLGGFDQRFFLYGEDADLCERARDAGARPVLVSSAVYEHVGGGSSQTHGAKATMLQRGKAEFLRTHWAPPRARLGTALLLTGSALRAGLSSLLRFPTRHDQTWVQVWKRRNEWRNGYSDPQEDQR